MTEDQGQDVQSDNTQKDPENWTTGGEPATGAQMSYVKTMADEASVTVPDSMTKAEASQKIDDLQSQTGRQGNATNE